MTELTGRQKTDGYSWIAEITFAVIGLFFGFILGGGLVATDMKNKQHTEKTGCEYVEQAPCKIIYIKEEK